MTTDDLRRIKAWFAAQSRRYRELDTEVWAAIRLKAHHTYQVCREARMLARGASLEPGRQRLAEATAVLHDVGRFAQFNLYRTFNDAASVDHASSGLDLIERDGVLRALSAEDAGSLVEAIAAHNRPSIPDGLSPTGLLLARILRDADKLDIWRIMIAHYEQAPADRNAALALGLPDTPGASPPVLERLRRQEAVRRSDLRNLNDLKLFQLGWVFDLNLPSAFQAVLDRRYIERVAGTLPASTAAIVDAVGAFARERAKREG